MRVYKLYRKRSYANCDYPNDMMIIMDALESKGEVLVSVETIENLYYEFSDKCACGWRIVDEDSINEFAEWLDEYEF